jgi:hypothetical protein
VPIRAPYETAALPTPADADTGGAGLAVGVAVAASAVPFLVLAPVELIGYDAFWHVFIARQDRWLNFIDEVGRNAHPPLFYLCLKAVIALFGTGPVVYRVVSVAASLGAAWLVGRIAQRLTGRPLLSAAAAFSFGASLSTVSVGLDVRHYALCAFFMLWACLALIELVERGLAAPGHRARVVFALMSSLALATHYGAALFLASAIAACATLAVIDHAFRRRLAGAQRQWRANLLAFAVPSAVFAVEYAVHVASWGRRLNHVPLFMFDAAREAAPAFVWRNTQALVRLFLPAVEHQPFASTLIATGPALTQMTAGLVVAGATVAVGWLACRPARHGERESTARRLPPLLLAVMTGLLIVLALAGRYPYGGPLRQQYFVFPFAILVLALIVDDIAQRSRRSVGVLAVGLFAVAGIANTVTWATQFRVTTGHLWQTQVDRLRETFPDAEVVYVDQFNLIHLFTHHHERQWRFARRLGDDGTVDVWHVSGPDVSAFYVCRDRRQWQIDLSARVTYWRVAQCLEATEARRVVVFRPQQRGFPVNWPLVRTEAMIADGAAVAGLIPDEIVMSGEDVSVSLTRRVDR